MDRDTAVAAQPDRKVLVVEDNELMTFTVGMMLTSLGYTVEYTRTAQQALDRFANGKTADLILSDIVLPGELSGIALAKLMHERDPELPVVLTTGFPAAADDGRAAGFTVLLKPYPLERLADELGKKFPKPSR